jgi:hypothetical protein
LAVVIGATASQAQGPTCTASWTGAAKNGDWATAGNWSGGIPKTSSAVCIGNGSNVLLGTGADVAVASLTLGGTLTIDGATLNLAAGVEVESKGTLDLNGTLDPAALWEPTSETVTVSKRGHINTTGKLCDLGEPDVGTGAKIVNNGTINAGAAKTVLLNGVSVTNNGTVSVTAGGALESQNPGTFTNTASGTVANKGTFAFDGMFLARGKETGKAVNLQGGTLDDDMSAGPGSFTVTGFYGIKLGGTGKNPGIPTTQTVTFDGDGATVSANFEIAGTLDLNGTLDPAALWEPTSETVTVSKRGHINTTGKLCDVGEPEVGTGAKIVNNGTIDAGATTTNLFNSVFVTNNGTISVPATSHVVNDGTLKQGKTGILAVTNNVTNRKSSRVTGGTYALGGRLNVTTIGRPTKAYSPISLAVWALKGHFGTLNFHGTSYRTTYASSAVTLTPSAPRRTSKTLLKLSRSKVTYGDEQLEHLSVTVSPRSSGSTPTGTVTVKESTTTLCVVKLASGKGSCKLSAKNLKAGTYRLFATYGGSTTFTRSTSTKEALTVAK